MKQTSGSHRKVVQHGSGISLWRQVAEEIRIGLQSGLADRNGKLPGELALAEYFGVNRHTVRAAIKTLAEEGVLEARQGNGTFVVNQTRVTYPIGRRTRFSDGIGSQAQHKSGKLLSSAVETASREVAQALGLGQQQMVLRLETVGLADGKPMTRSTIWFDPERFDTIDKAYARTGSITRALGEYGVDDYYRAWTNVAARHANSWEAEALDLSVGSILLITTAVNADANDNPIQYSITRFAADRVTLSMTSEVVVPS